MKKILLLLITTLLLTSCLTNNEDQLKKEITEKGNITIDDNLVKDTDLIKDENQLKQEVTEKGNITLNKESELYQPITREELLAFTKVRLKRAKDESITIDNWSENRDLMVVRAEARAEILIKTIENKDVKQATLLNLVEEAGFVSDILFSYGDYLAEAQRPNTYIDKLLKFVNNPLNITKKYVWDLHYTWDMNEDMINDCANDYKGDVYLGCDDTQDYTQPKYIIPGVENGIVFDKVSGKWVNKTGICHTCTEENGYGENGLMID